MEMEPHRSALKRTIGNNWIHVICSIWIPEIKYGIAETMDPVECVGIIDRKRWITVILNQLLFQYRHILITYSFADICCLCVVLL